LLPAIKTERYLPGEGGWLQFLDALREIDRPEVPFWPQLQIIITTHENGYQAEQE
jgi:hypothetical protein